MKKTPLKRGNSKLKSTPLKSSGKGLKKGSCKIKVKPKTEEQKAVQEEQFEKDKEFYMSIWNNMPLPRRCFETGKLLPSEPNLMLFHHCLPKSQFESYRHKEWNIVVVLAEVHAMTHSDDSKTPKIKQYTEELKQKHLNGEL